MNLPWEDRVVDIFTYMSVFTEDQKLTKARNVMMSDGGMTTDEMILDVAVKKQVLADGLFEITQSAAIDCELHFHEHGAVTQCMKYPASGGPTFAYHPDYVVDLNNSPLAAQYKAEVIGGLMKALGQDAGASAAEE